MARRGLRLLAAVAVTIVIYSAVSILIQSARVVSATDPSIVYPQSKSADAGAPSGRARPDGATPTPGVHARPIGASTPAARDARRDGASTAGRARREEPSLRQPHEHGEAVHGTTTAGRARREGPRSLRQPHEHGGVVHGASTAAGRTRREGPTLRQPHEHGGPLRLHAEPGGASTKGAQARADGASTADTHAGSDGASSPPPRRTAPQAKKTKSAPECHDYQHCQVCHCHFHVHQAAAPPPPPAAAPPPPRTATAPTQSTSSKKNERSTINRSMLVIGCLYSLLSFCNPMIILWSTGMSVAATDAFCGWCDLIASALSSLGWLLFALSQLHGEDGKVIGTSGVVVNAIGFALYAAYLVAKLAVGAYMHLRGCLCVLLLFFVSYVVIILVTVYGPLKRESKAAAAISVVAFILQMLSQLIPLITVLPLVWSVVYPPPLAERPEHINSRKLTVFSKVGSFGLSLFWVSYCTMTYEHDLFQLANDVGAAISFLTMILYLVYTLRPHEPDYPDPDP